MASNSAVTADQIKITTAFVQTVWGPEYRLPADPEPLRREIANVVLTLPDLSPEIEDAIHSIVKGETRQQAAKRAKRQVKGAIAHRRTLAYAMLAVALRQSWTKSLLVNVKTESLPSGLATIESLARHMGYDYVPVWLRATVRKTFAREAEVKPLHDHLPRIPTLADQFSFEDMGRLRAYVKRASPAVRKVLEERLAGRTQIETAKRLKVTRSFVSSVEVTTLAHLNLARRFGQRELVFDRADALVWLAWIFKHQKSTSTRN